ncbi:MAG: hypothetical protein AAF602_29815 [Myxococcota bacterium]
MIRPPFVMPRRGPNARAARLALGFVLTRAGLTLTNPFPIF